MKGKERLAKFLHLKAQERSLLLKSCFLLAAVRLGLSLLPFRTLLSVLRRVAPVPDEQGGGTVRHTPSVKEIAWALGTAGRYIPGGGTCLMRALAAQVLLHRTGRCTQLSIGVSRTGSDRLEAHAWLESDGEILFGDLDDLTRFSKLEKH